MKTLILGYADQDSRMLTVPDTFDLNAALTAGEIRWDDDGHQGWVEVEGLRTAVLMTQGAQSRIVGTNATIIHNHIAAAAPPAEELLTLRTNPDPRPAAFPPITEDELEDAETIALIANRIRAYAEHGTVQLDPDGKEGPVPADTEP